LNRLSLVARHVRPGQATGERRSTKRGTSVEFADYRDYAKGDDLRRVDWNIYARLERPFIKLFEEKEDLAVHILLDCSASMDWGADSENKWQYARQLAAALGYIALTAGDRLTVTALRSEQTPLTFGPVRGPGHTLRLIDWLASLDVQGPTHLNTGLRAYAIAGGRAGLTLLITDLFSPAGYLQGVTSLAARGHEVAIIHILSPDEIDPPLGGDLRLIDVETGAAQEVTIDGGMRDLYRRRLAAWRDEIGAACRARDVTYLPVQTDLPLEQLVLTELRRTGLIR
jgi:uncharacterized protein (DUF58 family)